jgi:hypothetical protein
VSLEQAIVDGRKPIVVNGRSYAWPLNAVEE